ncbi:MAG: PTS sugar transporter subunit IIB [Syntrophales bacterium]|nr:PTS sugar transporter subunit IIB [Syntrophales bacterium]
MNIVLVRVDSRLVHGQIIEAWVPFLEAKCIIVVNDEVAGDLFRETLIRMAVPRGVDVVVHSVEEFARSGYEHQRGERKTIILFACLSDVVRAFKMGFRFPRINIGNVYTESCVCQLSSCVQLSEEDVRNLQFLVENGVDIELRRVPKDKPKFIKEFPVSK